MFCSANEGQTPGSGSLFFGLKIKIEVIDEGEIRDVQKYVVEL